MRTYEGWSCAAVLCLASALWAPIASAQTEAVLGPTVSAIDMDSVEGFFCALEANGLTPHCATNGANPLELSSFAISHRVALDAAGRTWAVRNPPPFSDEPGLYVEVDSDDILYAELPPLAGGDYVDSIVLIGAPEMQTIPGVPNPLPLRTPVVLTAFRRLFVYAWWTEAENFTQDPSGTVVSTGNTVAVTPGWYEVDVELNAASGNNWLLASQAAPPIGTGAFSQTFITLSHARLGNNIRVPMILYPDAVPSLVPMHVKASMGGGLLFARFRLEGSALPRDAIGEIRHGLMDTSRGVWGQKPFFPRRFAWSPDYYISAIDSFLFEPGSTTQGTSGPFVVERGRQPQLPGLESSGPEDP